MKKTILLPILLLFFAFQTVDAATFNVTQNVVFKTASCTNPPFRNGQYNSWLGKVTVNVSHDIDGLSVGSPFLANTINYDCWRYIYFDIYKQTPWGWSLEGSVSKYDRWLKGAAYDYGSSSNDYYLYPSDMEAQGISAGVKQIRIRVYYNYYGQTPHVINVTTQRTGTTYCVKNNAEGSNFQCSLGTHRCIDWYPCTATISPLGYISLTPLYDFFGNIVGYIQRYTYNANVSGGSGSYSYDWDLAGSSAGSSGSGFTFNWNNPGSPSVSLTVTDNVSGCVYTWNNKTDGNLEVRTEGDPSVRAWPNPAAAGQAIELEYLAPEQDMVDIDVYDLQGRKVADVMAPQSVLVGIHNASIQTQLPAGTYFVRLTTSKHGSATTRIVVQ